MSRPLSAAIATTHGPLAALFHDATHPPIADAELDWYIDRLTRDGGRVLNGMAGSGRLLLPLAAAGFSVHGVDHSAAMIKSCERRLATATRKALLFRQDIAALNVPFRYAAAVIAGGAFQRIVAPTRIAATLQRLRAHLLAPGNLLIDLFVPALAAHPPGAPVVEIRRVTLGDGSLITLRTEVRVDVAAHRIDTTFRFEHRRGRTVVAREDETRALTWYTEDEILRLAKDAGYRNVRIAPSAISAHADEQRFALSAEA